MEKRFMKGCEAIAEAAVRGGCRFFAGYPITPQNEIPEYLSWRLPEVGGAFVQGESEVASINMVYGAAATGKRALTSSSGPGISFPQLSLIFQEAAPVSAQFSLLSLTIFRLQRHSATAVSEHWFLLLQLFRKQLTLHTTLGNTLKETETPFLFLWTVVSVL